MHRNRVAVFLSLFVAASVLAILINHFVAARDVRRERDRAFAAVEQERQAKEELAARLVQVELINKTVLDIFSDFDIRKVKAGPEPVEAVLAQRLIEAGRKLDARAIDDPLVLANLQNRLGQTVVSLGQPREATEFLKQARDIRQTQLGSDHPDTLDSMNALGSAHQYAGQLDLALLLMEKTLKLRQARLGVDHPNSLVSMHNLANIYSALGRHADALKLREETLVLRKVKLGPEHPDTLASMVNLAISYSSLGRHADALRLREETVARRQVKLGPDHPETLRSLDHLALSYRALGRHVDAIRLHEQTLAHYKVKLGPDHPDTPTTMNNLAEDLLAAGQIQRALPLFEETLRLRRAKLGADQPSTLASLNNLAWSLAHSPDMELRDPGRAVQLATSAAQNDPKSPGFQTTLGSARYRVGDWKGAIETLEQAIELRKPDDPANAKAGFFLAMAHGQLEDKDKARTWFDKSIVWMNLVRTDDADLQRLHVEAARLLGLETKD